MRVEHTIIFKIDELSEEAQRKAWEKSLEHFDMPWNDENRRSLEEFCRIFPVEAKDWSYGDQTSITSVMNFSEYDDEVWDMTGLRLRTWLLNNFDHVLWKGRYYGKLVGEHPNMQHRKRYSKAIIERACCPFTGYCMDDALMDPIHKFIEKPDNRTLEDLLGECLWLWVHTCQEDYEYATSFECFVENAQANEWEFYADGSMV